jgi:hypothetical protein
MEVALLPLPTSLRAKLFAAGHFTTTTLLFLTPLELARGTYECISLYLSLPPSFLCGFFFYQQCRSFVVEAQLSNEEALSVLKLVPRSSSSSSSDGIISASSALDGNSLFALISIAMATAHAPAHLSLPPCAMHAQVTLDLFWRFSCYFLSLQPFRLLCGDS